jgi:hypothetical protein
MVLNDELSRNRSAITQREGRRPIQLFIREVTHGVRSLVAVSPQKLQGIGLCHSRMISSVARIHFSYNFIRDVRDRVATGDRSSQFDFDRVNAGHVVDNDAYRP